MNLGWYKENKEGGTIVGTYMHGIFENDSWRNQYLNLIRKSKNLPTKTKKSISYKIKRESIINKLANEFDKHLNITSILKIGNSDSFERLPRILNHRASEGRLVHNYVFLMLTQNYIFKTKKQNRISMELYVCS